jgi:tetratricopeptide (TPR) repeat protein
MTRPKNAGILLNGFRAARSTVLRVVFAVQRSCPGQELDMQSRFFHSLTAAVLCSALVSGQNPARDAKKEQIIWKNLAAVAPGAVETFQRGTVAMDKGDYAQAVQLYKEVAKQAPVFSPVLRRLGLCLAAAGRTDEGLKLIENAVKIDRSPENLVSLAQILAYPAQGRQGTKAQREIALTLAKEASDQYKGSGDPSYSSLVAQLALGLEKMAEFRQATETLTQKYPDVMATHYFNAIRLVLDEKWVAAEDEIKKAQRLGLPAQVVQRFLDAGVYTRAAAWRWAFYAFNLVAAWACGLFILFV